MKKKYKIHFICKKSGDVILARFEYKVPRVDDEIRINMTGDDILYYRVTKVVWVYDEPDCVYSRVNIGIEKAV